MFIPMTMVLLLVVLFMFGFIGTVHYVDSKMVKLFKSMSKRVKIVTEADLSTAAAASGDSSRVVTNSKVVGGGRVHEFCDNNDELKKIFATFDKNGDGVITRQELREAMKAAGMVMGEEEVEEMVEKMDGNGDGLIDLREFCESFQTAADGDEEEVLREAFDVFDGNKDGVITVEELGKVLKMMGWKQGLKMEDCEEMIRKVDVDGDGRIDFGEFKKMMKAGGSLLASSSSSDS